MTWLNRFDFEDIVGLTGVALVASALSFWGIVWMLLFLGGVLMVLAAALAGLRVMRPRS